MRLLAVLAALAVAAPLPGAAATGAVCAVLPGGAAPELERAWQVERRKAGLTAALHVVAQAAACPADAALRVVVAAGRAQFTAADGATFARSLDGLSPWQQGEEVARAALDALGAASARPVAFSVAAGEAPAPAAPLTVRWGAAAGGVYTVQPAPGAHRGGVQVEAQAALADEVWLVALRFGWLPAQPLRGAAAAADLDALAVGARAAWGVRLAPVWLRLGAGVEAERRALTVRPPARLDTLERVRWAFVATAEAELELPLTDALRLTLAAGARVSPWGTGFTWQGEPVYQAPVVAGALALRLGWWF